MRIPGDLLMVLLVLASASALLGQVDAREIIRNSAVAGDNVSESILAQARQTGPRARLIEGAPLLDEVGGVGVSVRYRV